jgi:hypothetical protein
MTFGPNASPGAWSSFSEQVRDAEEHLAGGDVGAEDYDEYAAEDMDAEGSPFQLSTWQRRAYQPARGGSSSPQASGDGIDSSISPGDADDAASSVSAGAGPPARRGPAPIAPVHARCMGDYDSRHTGRGVTPKVPLFSQGTSFNSKWQCFNEVDEDTRCFRPVRTIVWNVPAELMDVDGKRFRHWSTPHSNPARAHNIAAVLGMAFTGTSKGFLCAATPPPPRRRRPRRAAPPQVGQPRGGHARERRGRRGRGPAGRQEEAAAPRLPLRVHAAGQQQRLRPHVRHRLRGALQRGALLRGRGAHLEVRELYTAARRRPPPPAAARRRPLRRRAQVFDAAHSDSELWRKLMDENRETKFAAGVAHSQCGSRKKNLVEEQKQHRIMTGGLSKGQLEYYAGTQYPRITTESDLIEALKSCAGRSMHNEGLCTCNMAELPPGLCATRIKQDSVLGGTHPLAPEYQFNAKRRKALAAWLVDFDGKPIDVHPHFLDPQRYFTDDGFFRLPEPSKKKGGFFFCIDPAVTNVFDLPLPRPIYGAAVPGPQLLALYKEEKLDSEEEDSRASVADLFTNFMTGKDAEHLEMEKQAGEAVMTFDGIGLTEAERKDLRHYGEMDEQKAYIIEPRQKIKECQMEARRVDSELVQPWLSKRRALREEVYQQVVLDAKAEGIDPADLDYHEERMQAVREVDEETQYRHCAVMKDLVRLHLSRIEAAFDSRNERETIPAGWCAMADYLKDTTRKLGTASIAWAFDNELVGVDTSAFAQTFLQIGTFFENDCFSAPPARQPSPAAASRADPRVAARSRGPGPKDHGKCPLAFHPRPSDSNSVFCSQDEVFFHFFEQYGDVTFLLLVCGYKVRAPAACRPCELAAHPRFRAGQRQVPPHRARGLRVPSGLGHHGRPRLQQGGHERCAALPSPRCRAPAHRRSSAQARATRRTARTWCAAALRPARHASRPAAAHPAPPADLRRDARRTLRLGGHGPPRVLEADCLGRQRRSRPARPTAASLSPPFCAETRVQLQPHDCHQEPRRVGEPQDDEAEV